MTIRRVEQLPIIGIICNAFGDPYSTRIMRGAADKLSDYGYHTLCFNGAFPDAPIYLNTLGEPAMPEGLSGLVLLSGSLRGLEPHLARIAAQSPGLVVSIGAQIGNAHTVTANDDTGVFQAVMHLAKHHGRKRIAFIAGPEGSADATRRLGAYRIALQSLNLPQDPVLLVRGDYEAQSGREAVLQLRRFGSTGFDAIVAANDLMAIGAMEALREGGIDVPRDVAVIGFDDMLEASFVSPALSTVRQPVYEQGISAVNALVRHLRGIVREESPTFIPSPLVIRASCGCNAGRPFVASQRPTSAPPDQANDQASVDDALHRLIRAELAERRTQSELSRAADEILAANDFSELATGLTRVCRVLKLRRFLLCAYSDDERRARVVLESSASGREVVFRAKLPEFPVGQLFPTSFLDGGEPLQVTLEPLKIGKEQFGYMVIDEPLRNASSRVELRHFMSAALARIARSRELRDLYTSMRRDSERRRAAEAVVPRASEPPATADGGRK